MDSDSDLTDPDSDLMDPDSDPDTQTGFYQKICHEALKIYGFFL
jgi:hypothetical protein